MVFVGRARARTLMIALLIASPVLATMATTGATDTEEVYALPIDFHRENEGPTITVLIIPPVHGQLASEHEVLGGMDPSEATMANSYVRAAEAAIANAQRGVDRFGPDWMQPLRFDAYVLGRDDVPQEVLERPDVRIMFLDHMGTYGGLAVAFGPTHPPTESVYSHSGGDGFVCTVFVTMSFLGSTSAAVMHDFVLHEFTHCLGVGHVRDDQPAQDAMVSSTDSDEISNPDHVKSCYSNLNVAALALSLGGRLGHPTDEMEASIPASEYQRMAC